MILIPIYICIALITGLLAGLAGIGGNLIATPLLTLAFELIWHLPTEIAVHIAITTGVMIMIFTTLSSTLTHHKHDNINWKFFKEFIPFIVFGVISGSLLSSSINGALLEKIFAIFIIIVAIKFLFDKPNLTEKIPHQMSIWLKIIIGFIIGLKSGLLGIGGGTMLIPLMYFLGYSGRRVTGTTAVFSFIIAVCGSITFLLDPHNYINKINLPYIVGNFNILAIIIMVPITMLSARIGAKQTSRIDPHILKKILAVFLLIISIQWLV